jgi:hypothetical protein
MSPSLDDLIAGSINEYLTQTHGTHADVPTVEAPATWSLCNILANYGVAKSKSTGVAARQIGPFRLAVIEDVPRDIGALITSVIPIALQAVVAHAVMPVAGYTAALTFAFRVLGATLSSGCLVEDQLEWKILLWIKAANAETPPRFPTKDNVSEHIRAAAESNAIIASEVRVAIEQLQRKTPLWGDKSIALIQERHDGGLQALA